VSSPKLVQIHTQIGKEAEMKALQNRNIGVGKQMSLLLLLGVVAQSQKCANSGESMVTVGLPCHIRLLSHGFVLSKCVGIIQV
jgi:hypothetical protein